VNITSEATCFGVQRHSGEARHRSRDLRHLPGRGSVAVDQGLSFSQVCPRCGGRGVIVKDRCRHCKGRGIEVRPRTVKVRIPAGVDDGQRIRVKGRGTPGANGGPAGDLYVVVHVAPHPVFAAADGTSP
jgi:molecular chaperone DnaJ